MENKTRYTMIDKTGNEIYSSNSFLGFIGTTILVCLMSVFVFALIGLVVSGISSLFN